MGRNISPDFRFSTEKSLSGRRRVNTDFCCKTRDIINIAFFKTVSALYYHSFIEILISLTEPVVSILRDCQGLVSSSFHIEHFLVFYPVDP